MRLDDARGLALGLMASHGLDGWTFAFDGARRRLGACWLHRRRITLSRHFVSLNDEELVRDVILHEIAHALTPGDGHGREFKRKARELGCNSASCVSSDSLVAAPARYLLECPGCGRSWRRYRRPAGQLACGACLGSGARPVARLRVLTLEPD